MAEIIKGKVQHRYDTAANYITKDPVLLSGEIGIESDTNKFKLGDGATIWTSLDYAGGNTTVDTATNLTSNNPILQVGEIGIESDTNKFKFGDGVSTWTSLDYAGGSDEVIIPTAEPTTLVNGSIWLT